MLKHVRRKGGTYSFDVKKPKQKKTCVRVPFEGLRSNNDFGWRGEVTPGKVPLRFREQP